MAKGNPIGWFEITGLDAAKTQKFYADLFGWSIEANNPQNYGMVQSGNDGIGGGLAGSMDGKPQVTVYADVDDVQASLDKAVSLGGKVVMPPMDVEGQNLKIALFADPDGNVIGLMKGQG